MHRGTEKSKGLSQLKIDEREWVGFMTFSSQLEAKSFLAAKITSEAEREGTALSDVEKRMLLFSEQEPETTVGFPDGYLDDIDEEYERRVTSLLKAAYIRDRDNPLERQQYEDAMKMLDGSDHYILVMAESALPRPIKIQNLAEALTSPSKTRSLIYIFIGAGLVVAIIAYVLLHTRS
ncbi:MAG TPA: hypothetical protein VKU42_12235 [Candidatus Angelobacter sp.]|nr:hypothetical protein [Candidatus Angelobacter sp.]